MSINLIVIAITTPIVNPRPINKLRPLTIFYVNVQGLIHLRDLKSKVPRLNMKKVHELHGPIFTNKPDIIILKETWLKKSIINCEILPDETYKILRADRSGKTHPSDPSKPKKYRKDGGGILIAHRLDIDIERTEVSLKKVQGEILTVNFKLPSGKKFSVSTFHRVGTLGLENFELV